MTSLNSLELPQTNNNIFSCLEESSQTKSDQTKSSQTKSDQTKSDQTKCSDTSPYKVSKFSLHIA